ncbi:MAG: phosphomannomutase/phosphoglucomutase [Bacteroidales bacterium]
MKAFHAYDIRGIYNVEFNKEDVYKIGFFLRELLNTDKILVGRDDRISSPEIHDFLLKGICDSGADVYDLGLATTPLVYFSTAIKCFDASVQITASHNPKQYNGLKISKTNALPVGYDTGLKTLETWVNEGHEIQVVEKKGQVFDLDMKKDYLKFQLRYLGDISNLNVTADLSNGMASLFIKDILGEGVKASANANTKRPNIHYLFDIMDGNFPNHEANPLIPENTAVLRKTVVENGSDCGVIYDGDADRVAFVDENGRAISPDLMIAVLGNFFLKGCGSSPRAKEIQTELAKKENLSAGTKMSRSVKRKLVTVIQDIRSSKAIGEYLAPMGGKMYTWKVGRAYAAPKLREIDGLFGGELAGHYYFKDFFYSDSGILASLILMDIVSQMKHKGVKLSELIDHIIHYENSGEINFRIKDKQAAMDKVRNYFESKETPTKVMDFDGYRLEFPDWWFNIRPSNTEPYLRFLCEATTKELLAEKISITRSIIEQFK